MDLIQALKSDLDKGFSKSDLERLIGLPKNSLSGIIAGHKCLSKKSELKVQRFMESEKPNPLELVLDKYTPKVSAVMDDIFMHGTAISKTSVDEMGEVKTERIDPISEEGFNIQGRMAIEAQIKAIEAEKLPKGRDTHIGRKSFKIEQQNRINELKKQLI